VNLKLVGERQIHRLLYPEAEAIQALRPKTRGDCKDGIRPCPWVGCRHHLYLNVNEDTGSMTQNFPKTPVWDLTESCSLDLADANPDGLKLESMAAFMELTKERIRQIEEQAKEQLRATSGAELGEVDHPRRQADPPPGPAKPTVRRPPHTPPRTPTVAPPPIRRPGPQMSLWILPPAPAVHRPRVVVVRVVRADQQLDLKL
jgi:hypothetical protein